MGQRSTRAELQRQLAAARRRIRELESAAGPEEDSELTRRLTSFAVERASLATFWIRPDARFIYVNRAACQSLGYSREELLGMTVHDVDPDYPRQRWPEQWQLIRDRQVVTFEAHHRRKDGTLFPVEITANYLVFEGEEYNCAFARDLSERHRSEARFRAVVENAPDYVALVSSERRFLYLNRAIDADPSSLVGRQVDGFLPKELRPDLRRAFDRAEARGESVRFRTRGPGAGDEAAWYDVRISPLPGDGEGFVLIATDVTEQRRAEEKHRRLEDQVRQAQKLESLGVLAGGIAHDFNNLLTGVLGNTSLALRQEREDAPCRKPLEQIQVAARRAAELTRQMLAYSGKARVAVQPVDLNALVEETSELFSTVISKKAELRLELAPSLPSVEGDASQLRQVVMNLITNASDSLAGEKGSVTLRTEQVEGSAADLSRAAVRFDPGEGPFIVLEVRDTGVGMDRDTQARLFEPFFTTKLSGRGLGMAAVLGIVRGHRGAIRIDSEPGRGTAVRVLFRAAPAATRRDEESLGAVVWQGSGTLLVVDDEETVRTTVRSILESCGYRVVTACDGREGLDLARGSAEELSAILLDLTMPELDGEALLAELRGHGRAVPVLLMSGYSEEDVASRVTLDGRTAFLHKPFTAEELLRTLQELLGR